MVKALVEVAGRTLVARSVASLAAGGVSRAVVVIPAGLEEDFAAALTDAPIPCELVVGGAERQESVARGLVAVGRPAVVLVHDAARPFVPADVVERVTAAVRSGAVAVTPVMPVTDSIRELIGDDSRVVDRALLRAVQTPQGFDADVLRAAHEAAIRAGHVATDDASVCAEAGHRVVLVTGSRRSFKITEPFDLLVAEALAGE